MGSTQEFSGGGQGGGVQGYGVAAGAQLEQVGNALGANFPGPIGTDKRVVEQDARPEGKQIADHPPAHVRSADHAHGGAGQGAAVAGSGAWPLAVGSGIFEGALEADDELRQGYFGHIFGDGRGAGGDDQIPALQVGAEHALDRTGGVDPQAQVGTPREQLRIRSRRPPGPQADAAVGQQLDGFFDGQMCGRVGPGNRAQFVQARNIGGCEELGAQRGGNHHADSGC